MLPVIGRDLHETVVCAGPDRALFYWRFGQCKHRIVIFDRGDIVRQRTAAWLLLRFIVAREITADLRPALAVVGRLENALRRRVEHVGIVRRYPEARHLRPALLLYFCRND